MQPPPPPQQKNPQTNKQTEIPIINSNLKIGNYAHVFRFWTFHINYCHLTLHGIGTAMRSANHTICSKTSITAIPQNYQKFLTLYKKDTFFSFKASFIINTTSSFESLEVFLLSALQTFWLILLSFNIFNKWITSEDRTRMVLANSYFYILHSSLPQIYYFCSQNHLACMLSGSIACVLNL